MTCQKVLLATRDRRSKSNRMCKFLAANSFAVAQCLSCSLVKARANRALSDVMAEELIWPC